MISVYGLTFNYVLGKFLFYREAWNSYDKLIFFKTNNRTNARTTPPYDRSGGAFPIVPE